MSDEVWRNTPHFVEKRHNKQWMWLAIDRATRELKKRDFMLEEEAGKMQGSSGNHYHPFIVWGVPPSDKWEARNNTEQAAENC
jgi:hypothetical protein